ncbi:DUF948 domain-containing protein [Alteribacillus bidgolensis]|uniref:Uncharacterized protein n=1 Tax=Alteribacillus bidgolensis TaxID=930129 RepID=A0A1G8PM36_9BACI|nr:DUF948 domain-containing protein [Alteribacillus bidgolensis]SDI93442.1 hypothetical protein SAMN05216352_11531 [Alteribacillus bidgolensis]
MSNQKNDKDKQEEKSTEENTLDLNGIWKAASSLIKDDTFANAISGMKDKDTNLVEVFKQYTENSSHKFDELREQLDNVKKELTEQLSNTNKELEQLNKKIEAIKSNNEGS